MKRHSFFRATLASLFVLGGFGSLAHAGLDSVNHSQWDEDDYYNGFGGPAPSGIVEYSTGFSTIGDFDGRVLSNAAVTSNTVDSSPLTTISTFLFANGSNDANLYKFTITNPSTFTASIPSTSLILALFSSNGTGLAASIGGTADTITAANAGVTTAGTYYIGIADTGLNPENAEGQNIFGLAGTAGVFSASTSDAVLATDPFIAWTAPGDGGPAGLLTNTSFTAPSSTISLTGSGFAVVPEPASISLLVAGGVGLLARRRRARA